MSFLRPVSDLRPGDHACLVYDSLARRDAFVLAFLDEGLAQGDKVIYLDDGSEATVPGRLEPRSQPGQLSVVDAAEAFLREGAFEPDLVLAQWRETVESCLAAFPTVRAGGGPPTTITSNGWSHRLADYERRANELFSAETFSAVCAYDVHHTDPAALLGVVDAHPIVVYAVEPDDRLEVDRPSRSQLEAHGWVDVTTLGGLVAPLADAIEAGDDVEVDLQGVDFVDVAGWRLFAECGDLLHASGHRLTLVSPPRWAQSVRGILGYDEREGLVLQ